MRCAACNVAPKRTHAESPTDLDSQGSTCAPCQGTAPCQQGDAAVASGAGFQRTITWRLAADIGSAGRQERRGGRDAPPLKAAAPVRKQKKGGGNAGLDNPLLGPGSGCVAGAWPRDGVLCQWTAKGASSPPPASTSSTAGSSIRAGTATGTSTARRWCSNLAPACTRPSTYTTGGSICQSAAVSARSCTQPR